MFSNIMIFKFLSFSGIILLNSVVNITYWHLVSPLESTGKERRGLKDLNVKQNGWHHFISVCLPA